MITWFTIILLCWGVASGASDSLVSTQDMKSVYEPDSTKTDEPGQQTPDESAVLDTSSIRTSRQDTAGSYPDSSSFASASLHGHEPDTADSARKAAVRDSLLDLKAKLDKIHSEYPLRPDSLFAINEMYPSQIFKADAASLTEILSGHPFIVPIRFSLSSSMNRFLYFGFPGSHAGIDAAAGMPPSYPDKSIGADAVSAAELSKASINPPSAIHGPNLHSHLSAPHVLMLWETGLFDENALNVRFARPLGRSVDIAVFSNYRYLQRKSYKHTNGGIYTFYRSMIEDTSYIVRSGFNPLTKEQASGAHLVWYGKNGFRAKASYRYMDLHNDIAAEFTDTTSPTVFWKERALYAHRGAGYIEALPLWKFRANIGGFIKNDVHRISDVSDSLASGARYRGESATYGASIQPFFAVNDDTTSIEYSLQQQKRIRFSGTKWKSMEQSLTARHSHGLNIGGLGLRACFSGGIDRVVIEDSLEQALKYSVGVNAKAGGQKLSVYTKRDRFPVQIPYDTSFSPIPGAILDRYFIHGAEALLKYRLSGITAGIAVTSDVDTSKARWFWPGGVLPYSPPKLAWSVSPFFGRWYGLAVKSSWIFADAKPYVKSSSNISFHSPGGKHRQRLFVDLGFDYWSEREPITYGGIDIWSRPIFDLHTKITVQIKTFRLFYRMDNLLNRKTAYVPGYFLPGLTFRWGFNWLLQG